MDTAIDNIKKMTDSDINFSDIPEILDWSDAAVGKFYRPRKQSVTIRIDSDVVSWVKMKSGGKKYQSLMNAALRAYMLKK